MSSSETENHAVKIVTADYYLHKPIAKLGDQCYSAFRSSLIYRVPVIRIFGPTSEGVKTCLHVHGVFPYIFVPNWNNEIAQKELYNFAASLDKAINISFGHANSKSTHVHNITQVSGTPFYGYHENEKNFLKIEFYNPAIIKKASDLLLNGVVLNTIFQPHESHIPYILQFFIDNNLYGMNDITFSGYKFRRNDTQEVDLMLDESVIGSSDRIYKQSHSALEIDITVSNLCSVSSNEGNIPNNPGLAFIWEDEKKRRRFNQKSSQITPNESQQRPEKPVTRTEKYFKDKLAEKLQAIKDNQACMDIEYDETPSSSTVYGELNSQSISLLEILQDLAGQQEKNKATGSTSGSLSLVYSNDEDDLLDCSQPLLKLNAEDDSILGNRFSDDENDIDDNDHQALSQTISYTRQQPIVFSDDSETELAGGIPQLDGAYDTKNVKKSASKRAKSSKPYRKVTYNLRSKPQTEDKNDQSDNFQPRDFKIVLSKMESLAKTTPKKTTYPRLSIDTQKSPRSNQSKSDFVHLCPKEPILLLPRLTNHSSGESLPSQSRTENINVSASASSQPTKVSEAVANNSSILLKSNGPILLLPRLTDELSAEFLPLASRSSIENTKSSSSLTKTSPTKVSRADDSLLPKSSPKKASRSDDSLLMRSSTLKVTRVDDSLLAKSSSTKASRSDDSLLTKSSTLKMARADDSLLPKSLSTIGSRRNDSLLTKSSSTKTTRADNSSLLKISSTKSTRADVSFLPKSPATKATRADNTLLPKSPSTKSSRSVDSSLLGSDKKVYPQLNITIKKSPKSAQKPTSISDEATRPSRVSTNFQTLKKRKINFGDDDSDSSKSKETMDADLLSPRWRKSLKRRKKDDTSFKIGDSFSLLEFQKLRKPQSTAKRPEKLTSLDGSTNTSEMGSQNYSLRLNSAECSNTSRNTLEKTNQIDHSSEMESLKISDDEDEANGNIEKSNVEEVMLQVSKLPLMECDDESLLAVPLETIEDDEMDPLADPSAEESSNSSIFRVPVLKLPRLCSTMVNDSVSASFYENSSIELNISDSIDSRTAFQSKLNENSIPTTSKFEEKQTTDAQHEVMGSNMISGVNAALPMSKIIEEVVRSSKNELLNVVKSHQGTETPKVETKLQSDDKQIRSSESNPIKVSKKPAQKKKSLGMRMRNSIKQPKNVSKSNQNTSKDLKQNKDDERFVEKLPMTLVDQGFGHSERSRSPELFSDSNIELEIIPSASQLSPKNPQIESSTSNEENPPSTTKHQNTSNSANSNRASCSKTKSSGSTKLTSPPCFEDSQIELDITKFCSKSFEDSTKEGVEDSVSAQNLNLAVSTIDNSERTNEASIPKSTKVNDTSCEKTKSKGSTKLTSPPCFEDSQIELDITKFCTNSFEDSTKESLEAPRNLAASTIDNNERPNEALPSTSNINSSSAIRERETSPKQTLKEKEPPVLSQSIFSDEILVGPTDAAVPDDNLICSQETLFEENPYMNENLPSSEFIFDDQSFISSNAKLPETFSEVDLFASQETPSQRNLMNENVVLSQSLLGDDYLDKSNDSLQNRLMDDNDTFFSQNCLPNLDNNVDENFQLSLSFFQDDDIPIEPAPESTSPKPNPSSNLQSTVGSAISQNLNTETENDKDDLNTSCSNDSLMNVLENLTPRTREALNRKLDSFEDENSTSVLSQEPPEFMHVDSEITRAQNKPSGAPKDSVILAGTENTKNQHQDLAEQSSSAHSSNIFGKSSHKFDLFSSSTKPNEPTIHDQILFEEDSFDLAMPAPSVQRENEPEKKTPTLDKLILNNSFWDSVDSDESTQEDNEIQSFYHNQSITPAHITVIRDIAENDDYSPIAKSLTPESQASNEILSFYGSQSPESMICSLSQSVLKAPEAKSTPNNEPSQAEISNRRSSGSSSSVMPRTSSTPAGPSTKRSPSPLRTPVFKKLAFKKGKEKDKRRISSQRFRSEPFLPEIEEEEESKKKEPDKNTTLSLPLELESDTSKIDANKSLLNNSKMSTCSGGSYQIDGPSLDNTCGFKMNLENLQDIKTDKQFQFITLISVEVFAATRAELKPDPEHDAIICVFYSIHHDAPGFPALISGIIVVSEDPLPADLNRFKCEKTVVPSEAELFNRFLGVIRKWDPDMFIGYEVEMLSWGFLIQRGHFLGRNLSQELSRVRETRQNEPTERPPYEEDEYSNEIKLTGRIVLNVWRLMRHEVNLQSYTFENIIFHVLHQRVPKHSFKFLTEWWNNSLKRWIVVDYFLLRAESNITLLEQLDFICRTSELAKLFGIQFYEVLSRGSQFRVESMMLRLAKTQNYVAVSPSVKQRAQMRAPESLPLIMEPQSKFYTDPVIVLDFQSLYPSIIIAYNYCFSTCLGRIDSLGQNEPFHFGCIEHTVPNELLMKLENSLNISPAGVAFVDASIRKGTLPSMLQEILETRLMVKASMKMNTGDSLLSRVLHARQLGLKLIANVTYGYTSANFSGRMPCMEIADSVVSKGRETLERAIELVNSTAKWGAKVVYGDTDSLFVLVPKRTKEEAFKIGAEIAEAVTNQNPKPVKLKLEKVYTSCILQTKKRYVGYMYESPNQEKPTYDAKGIETVRRDGCPAVSKILEKSLKLLFETKNVNTVKQYVQRQFTKLIAGRISIQELTFAREYRGMNSYKPAACVPALQLAKDAVSKDRRAEPRIKERVRYVIVTGAPGVSLIKLVCTPEAFLDTPGSLINTEYYITRAIIPALARCFNLLNVNVQAWYTELPKKQRLNLPIDYDQRDKNFKKTVISDYFNSSKCISCSKAVGSIVCKACEHLPQRLALILGNMSNRWQRKRNYVSKICRSCCGRNQPIECSSLDCPIYYLLRQTDEDAKQVGCAENLKQKYLYF
ncbi:DNA polymerase zeta catalytic subunit [Planococcus citri]|uniref:DNA polymerase zeta catalytic subunit n=1 Tax=Planococcus citri TaxID=170843 RepID=UPI0031F79F10